MRRPPARATPTRLPNSSDNFTTAVVDMSSTVPVHGEVSNPGNPLVRYGAVEPGHSTDANRRRERDGGPMTKPKSILLQTTIVDTPDDWHVSRFSLLADELRTAGHNVTARNRDDGEDSVLSVLDSLDYDQLWLLAVDTGDGLTPEEAAAITRFRLRGGGLLTARDHQDLGLSLRSLGAIGALNHFHRHNPEPVAEPDDPYNPDISWPNYHSGANGDYQRIVADAPIHELLLTDKSPTGHVEWFPAHPHEGAVSAPPHSPCSRVIAHGQSAITGRRFNLVVCTDGERTVDGRPLGRAVVCSTFHHFADMNWDIDRGAPSFVTDPPGSEIKQDPSRLEAFKDYVRNIADWL